MIASHNIQYVTNNRKETHMAYYEIQYLAYKIDDEVFLNT